MSQSERKDEEDSYSNYSLLMGNEDDATPTNIQRRLSSSSLSMVSLKSNRSKDTPVVFKESSQMDKERANSPTPSVGSVKSDQSKDTPVVFKQSSPKPVRKRTQSLPTSHVSASKKSNGDRASSPTPSVESLRSDRSKDTPVVFKNSSPKVDEQAVVQDDAISQESVSDVFQQLQEKMGVFVNKKLKKMQQLVILDKDACELPEVNEEQSEDEMNINEAFLNITVMLLKTMKKDSLAGILWKKTHTAFCLQKLKANLKEKNQHIFEGIAKAGNPTFLNQIYTELYITEKSNAAVNSEHEVRLIEKASKKLEKTEITINVNDMFKPSVETKKSIRTVITNGVAGIGKTILTRKFTLDWAEGKTNQDVQLLFPFCFRELNLQKEKKFSLVELIHHYFPETNDIKTFEEFKILFIFDGLDECRLPLNMNGSETVRDVNVTASVDVLLINLFKRNLLPSAQIWITTRPAAASQILPDCVDLVTEVRGFTDPQKEEYFKKKIKEEKQAQRIISHVKSSRSLHIMCHIPIFCWITATVLEDVFKTGDKEELPKTLTEMYIRFLVVQCRVKKVKFDGGAEEDSTFGPETKMIASLAKLAFEQLLKGNIYFYESDLKESGIDVREASVYSGVFTQIFVEESGLDRGKMFSFVHLTVQEFLAALHVHQMFFNNNKNLLSEPSKSLWSSLFGNTPERFYQRAVDMAVDSPNGQFNMFLRFLLGLSLQSNQTLLQALVTQTESGSNSKTVLHIKKKINENTCAEKTMNLFHCLSELRDTSLVEEIQKELNSGSLSTESLSPAQWSALVFILLSSDKSPDEFDLKRFLASDLALHHLLPVVKESTKAMLSCCNLSEESCSILASALTSQCSNVKELDLSNNDLKDSGLILLCKALESKQCTLEILRLSGCLITPKGYAALVSALKSNPSHLKELDLSYNHIEKSEKFLFERIRDPNWALTTLKTEPSEFRFLKSGLAKYACKVVLDRNTAHKNLLLSGDNKRVTMQKDKQQYPDHPERFDYWKQVMGTTGFTGRCYWEVEWTGQVYLAMTYKGIRRKGEADECCLGKKDFSWSLLCSETGHSALHNNEKTGVYGAASKRVGVYLDYDRGILSFFRVSPGVLKHLKTFQATFTEPLYPAFRIRTEPFNSSLVLYQIE